MLPRDPMESYEQAEAEANARYYEERDDLEAALIATAKALRQRALWNAHCVMDHRNPEHCPCIEACATCGHLAAEHALTDGVMYGVMARECERHDCGCRRFTSSEE